MFKQHDSSFLEVSDFIKTVIVAAVFVILTSYIVILRKKIFKVKKEEKKRQENIDILRQVGMELLDIQLDIITKENRSRRDVLMAREIGHYIMFYLLLAMTENISREQVKNEVHGYIMGDYPEIFAVFEKEISVNKVYGKKGRRKTDVFYLSHV